MSEERKVNKESIGEKSFRKSNEEFLSNLQIPDGNTKPIKKAGGFIEKRE
jgi:hypothetical protein